jgi:hypothetical protein
VPTLPLPGPVIPAADDLAVNGTADVLAVLPVAVRAPATAPVRDGLAAALTGILRRHELISGYAAALSDILRSTGLYLQGLCEDRSVFLQLGETDEALRARALAVPDLVTPSAILALVNALLAPSTVGTAQLFESAQDRIFISDGTADWHSFIGAAPSYGDRLYPDDALANDGFVRPQSDPGASWVFGDAIGRYFVLRIPEIAPVDGALIYDGTLLTPTDGSVPELGGGDAASYPELSAGQLPPASGGDGLFLGDGSNTSGAEADGSVATFLYPPLSDPLSVYQQVASAVERIKGQSIRWALGVDATL